ncbi:MAG: translation initiation factor IF-2 [Proteocatella sp.]
MEKIRIHKLAKDLGLPTKELIDMLSTVGFKVESHMAAVTEQEAQQMMKKLASIKMNSNERKEETAPIKQETAPIKEEITPIKQETIKKEETKKDDMDNKTNTQKNHEFSKNENRSSSSHGEKRPYQGRDDRRNQSDDSRSSHQGNSQGGERRPYQGKSQSGERKPYQGNSQGGERKPYQGNSQSGERKPYQGNSQSGERKPYQGNSQSGERKPYQGNSQSGERKPYQGNSQSGERKPYSKPNSFNKSAGSDEKRDFVRKDSKKEGKEDLTKEELLIELKKEEKRKDLKIEEIKKAKDKNKKENKFATGEIKYEKRDLTKKTHGKKKRKEKADSVVEEVEVVPVEGSVADGIISMGETIVVGEFAKALNLQASDIIMKLVKLGIMANINQEIKFETAEKIAEEYDVMLMKQEVEEEPQDLVDIEIAEDKEEDLKPRAPIVAVMGHVDHGKTTLLDTIRHTGVAEREAGGITQHIGASEVVVNDQKIVFLDTPGHEAFTEMRARGAKVTDIAIIVVAADDGIMPQTVEAINHVRASGVPLIIAINKIDKPTANIEKVRQELSGHGLLVEAWGGDVIDCPVSAKSGEGIDNLLQMILLVSEVEELKANPNREAVGWVIESNLDKGRGPVATILVLNGTLKVGDSVVAGSSYGRVRAMINSKGNRTGKVGPSTAVEILGLNEVPNAGDQFVVVGNEKQARIIAEKRRDKIREDYMKATSKIHLEDLFSQMQQGSMKELNLIVKADVQGSIEALRGSLEKISNEEVLVRVIHSGVGAITESDVMLATASNAIIIGFNVRPSVGATTIASREQVDIRTYSIIYQAIEEIETAMKGMLDPEFVEEQQGTAEVREVFKVPGAGMAAGCYVTKGKIERKSKVRLIRDGIVIYDGEINSLRRFRDEVKEVATGYECGISLEKYSDIKQGDIIEAYFMKEVKRK